MRPRPSVVVFDVNETLFGYGAGRRSPNRAYGRMRVTAAACSAWRAWSQSPVQ